jgi:RimJ/RimL family protein N-acetyltransferase
VNLDDVDPSLLGDRVAIRPISPSDVVTFHAVEHTAAPLDTSRLGGRTLSLERYAESLQASVLAGMTIVDRSTGDLIGYGLCYDPDFVSDRAKFAVMTVPSYRRSTRSINGVELFLRYVFENFPFRALYADVFEQNLAQFEFAERAGLLERQGTYPDYQFWKGRYVTMHTFRVTRAALNSYLDARPAAVEHRPQPATFEEFAEVLRSEFGLRAAPRRGDVAEEIGFDSLAHTELALLCEELFDQPLDTVVGVSIGELFDMLRRTATSGQIPASGAGPVGLTG